MSSFADLLPQDIPVRAALLKTLAEEGLSAPTEVQAAAIPALLAGKDVQAQAATGSGKTLACALPILARLRPERRPQALILAPTRELCAQIVAEFRRFGRGMPGLRVLGLGGGEPIFGQARALSGGAHVIAATPGRLADHLRRGAVEVEGLQVLVLDEADRMLEMGFAEELNEILSLLPPRQTALFSATFPPGVARLANDLLSAPARIAIAAPPPLLEYATITAEDRLSAALSLIERLKPASALIFCNQRATVGEVASAVAERLSLAGQRGGALPLQGDMMQEERDDAMARFRSGSAPILVATDVAARGLDIDSVELVIHYDLPETPESWTHRSGRTGRAGSPGLAVALVRPGREERLSRVAGALPPALSPDRPPLHAEPRAKLITLRVSSGRRDKLRPGDLLGALTKDGGLPGAAVGKIEVQERKSYVTVDASLAAEAAQALGRVKGRRLWVDKV